MFDKEEAERKREAAAAPPVVADKSDASEAPEQEKTRSDVITVASKEVTETSIPSESSTTVSDETEVKTDPEEEIRPAMAAKKPSTVVSKAAAEKPAPAAPAAPMAKPKPVPKVSAKVAPKAPPKSAPVVITELDREKFATSLISGKSEFEGPEGIALKEVPLKPSKEEIDTLDVLRAQQAVSKNFLNILKSEVGG